MKKKPTQIKKKAPVLKKKAPLSKIKTDWNSFTVVAIGASAGGLEAVTQFLKSLSPTTGMAFIYVQHLSPDHKSILTSILSKVTSMKVQDVEDMDKMEPNNVYVMPYNKGIEVTDGHIALLPRAKGFTLSIDVLFTSLAQTHKENVIGVVLSGSGTDGTEGLKDIKLVGGITFAQNETSKFKSMPQSAIAAGVADFVLSPSEIGKKINWISKHPLIKSKEIKAAPEDSIDDNDVDLYKLIQLLHKKKSVDFSHYKKNTIKRRILRRMLIHKMSVLKEYTQLCEKDNHEVNSLYDDLLINVTEFFRDPDSFLFLKKSVLPQLLKNKKQGDTLRIWVPACATGEEVYSIAMLLLEVQDSKYSNVPFQIFASDLSTEAITNARNGEYSKDQLKNVSSKRLQRFFTKTKDKYRISKSLRDVCIFAIHNILTDPPFSRMDFISCRNLLIYLDTLAQKKIISTFNYALNENGCLMLGKSETVGASIQLFSTQINKKYKIYTRKKSTRALSISDISPRVLQTNLQKGNNVEIIQPSKAPSIVTSSLSTNFDSFLLAEYAPASVVINHDLEILQFRGNTSPYLLNTAGKASLNILKMAHMEITFELRNAIHHAIKTKQTVRKTGIEMNRDKPGNAIRIISLDVTPIKIDGEEDLLVIVFSGLEQPEIFEQTTKGVKNNSISKDRRIKKLEEEISASRYDMASITQDQEAANEELQSANEEIVSSNEELQSLNEELETSKEEIESTNEELITTNQELQARIQQVEEIYNYYESILSTIHEPMLILDKDICIKSANQSFCKMFHVTQDESVGISLFKLGNNQWNIPKLRDLLESILIKNKQFQDFEVEHTFPDIGQKTMLLNAHKIVHESSREELIVLTISDITKIKLLAKELQVKENKALELQLEIEKKANKKIEESNVHLIEAKKNADVKTKIAEDAVISKQQFLSNMSHEIRTPMNSIIGFTNILLKTELNSPQKEYVSAVKESGEALIILINDILDLAKVNSGKMTFEQIPFNLSDSIAGTLQLFETKILEKNLKLIKDYDASIPAIVIGDPMRLRQIILNLVSNAVKFTSSGSITIKIKSLNEDEDKIAIEFSIADTGIGIHKNQLGRIFEDFGQEAYETSRLYGGTGLGLSIVKKLVELQGGTIEVKSKRDYGSTFSFVFRFKKGKTMLLRENGNEKKIILDGEIHESKLKDVKVLVAEDIALNQLLIKIILSDYGFDFDIAGNGKLAIEMMHSKEYDIVLMDLQMPEMNGFQATEHIRKVMKSTVPIIALTADVTSMDVEKCIAIGMNDYISKPIDENELYNKIIKFSEKKN